MNAIHFFPHNLLILMNDDDMYWIGSDEINLMLNKFMYLPYHWREINTMGVLFFTFFDFFLSVRLCDINLNMNFILPDFVLLFGI